MTERDPAELDYLDEAIERLSEQIERVLAPVGPQVGLLRTIPGVDRRMAEALIAETGVDMSRFGSAGRLASWAGICPGQHVGRPPAPRHHPQELQVAAGAPHPGRQGGRPHQGHLPLGPVRAPSGRRGGARATIAVAHSILVAVCYILERGTPYEDLGADWFIRRHSPERHARRLMHQIEALRFDVQIQERATA